MLSQNFFTPRVIFNICLHANDWDYIESVVILQTQKDLTWNKWMGNDE